MKSSELISFENPTLGTLRGFIDGKTGEPWFLAAQVCRCLGIKNSAKAVSDLKQRMQVVDDWNKNRGVTSSYSPKAKTITLQEGKTHTQLTIIPESWLYELIFASRKQSAIVFRAWVTHEVLPKLRKHGSYCTERKIIRRTLTDTIKTEIVDKSENPNAKFSYSNFSVLINKSLGLPSKIENINTLPDDIQVKLAKRTDLVRCLIDEGRTYGEIKNFIESFNKKDGE